MQRARLHGDERRLADGDGVRVGAVVRAVGGHSLDHRVAAAVQLQVLHGRVAGERETKGRGEGEGRREGGIRGGEEMKTEIRCKEFTPYERTSEFTISFARESRDDIATLGLAAE